MSGPYRTARPRLLGDSVKVAQFNAREELPPLVCGKFTNRAVGVIRIANQDNFAPPRNSYTCAAVAGT
jgi:hypothetical protein